MKNSMELFLENEILLLPLWIFLLFPTPKSFFQIFIATCPAVIVAEFSYYSLVWKRTLVSLWNTGSEPILPLLSFFICGWNINVSICLETKFASPLFLYSPNVYCAVNHMPHSEMDVKEYKGLIPAFKKNRAS